MNNLPVAPAATEYLYRKAAAVGIPLSGTFELTPLCNMDCKMCYVRLSRERQEAMGPLADAQRWLALGRQAREAGMLYLLLTGGEPFLHPQFRAIMEGLHQMGFLISLNTNATLIDEETVQWLKACPPVRVNVSLYGASDATYHRLCGNSRGFAEVKRAIALLLEAGISVKLNCSLTPHNAADLPEIADFARQRGLALQVATYMFPPLRKDGALVGKNDRFTPREAAWYMAYADLLTLGKERFLAQEGKCPIPELPEEHCLDLGDGVRCRAGRCSFWVSWQGDLMPCGMFPTEGAPNVFSSPFVSAWEKVKENTAAIRLPAECALSNAKSACRACAAMVLTESGCFHKVPQYRCEMMQAYPAQWQRVKEEML